MLFLAKKEELGNVTSAFDYVPPLLPNLICNTTFPPSLFTLKELLKNQATLSLDAVSSVASNGTFPKREGEKI